jgi:hypothetical protein
VRSGGVEPTDLGVCITFLVPPPPRTDDSAPDCDFAVPFCGSSSVKAVVAAGLILRDSWGAMSPTVEAFLDVGLDP